MKKLLVFALTSGLAARAVRSWLAQRDQRRQSNASGPRSEDNARWADDGGRVMPPVQNG